MTSRQTEAVVLVHGLGGSRLNMKPLAKRLVRLGFAVCNWGYWSLATRTETHASRLAEKLLDLEDDDSVNRVHLVSHSMGGIIIRAMLAWNSESSKPRKIASFILRAFSWTDKPTLHALSAIMEFSPGILRPSAWSKDFS